MRKVYKISKSRLYAGADYSAVLSGGDLSGYKLNRVTADKIELTTGEVCFFDPYNPGSGKPFTTHFQAGEYSPFMFLIATTEGERVALAGLDGGLENADRWRLALTDDRDIITLNSGNDSVGVTIGSGFGALCDKTDYTAFVKLTKAGEDTFHPLDGAVNMNGGCAQVCDLKGLKLPVFNTGWGEGRYSAYIGYEGDVPKGIICDFGMVHYPAVPDSDETEEFELEVSAEDLYVPDPKKSDAENSIAQYTAVINGNDDSPAVMFNAYSRRGYSYHTSGRFDEAIGDYLKAINIGRENKYETNFVAHAWSLYDNAASIYCDAGKTDEAIKLYEEAKGISDTFYSGAYSGLIDIYRGNKAYDKALAVADEMVATRPKDPSAYLKRSEIYMACEEYEKAIADLDVLIAVYKLNECILDKSMCLSFLGRYKEALAVLDTYLLEGRASEVYYDLRAEICLADNDFSSAYNDARKAFDVNPDYPATLEKLIKLDGLLLNFKNVVKWATRYVETRPRTEFGYIVRAEANFESGEYEDAIADYMHLMEINATPRFYGLIVKTALAGSDIKLAKKYTKLLRKLDNAYYIYAVGLMLLYEKKYARAERYIASALALREEDVILASLIDCFTESGDYAKAEAAIKRYAALSDAEEGFLKHARIAVMRGIPSSAVLREYITRFLSGCEDDGLLEKTNAYFRSLQNKRDSV